MGNYLTFQVNELIDFFCMVFVSEAPSVALEFYYLALEIQSKMMKLKTILFKHHLTETLPPTLFKS